MVRALWQQIKRLQVQIPLCCTLLQVKASVKGRLHYYYYYYYYYYTPMLFHPPAHTHTQTLACAHTDLHANTRKCTHTRPHSKSSVPLSSLVDNKVASKARFLPTVKDSSLACGGQPFNCFQTKRFFSSTIVMKGFCLEPKDRNLN